MKENLIDLLVCPACHHELEWHITEHDGDRIERGTAKCPVCPAEYPIEDGIGLFLIPNPRRDNRWKRVDDAFIQYLKDRPELESQLMNTPVEQISPVDLFYRALVLEERGDFAAARRTEELANEGIYTPEYNKCARSQISYVVDLLSKSDGLIVDLDSRRGYLLEEMARSLNRPVAATNINPLFLRRHRRYLEFAGLYDRVSLLALDARRTPFRDRVIATLTTNNRLPWIKGPWRLLPELRRITSGTFYAITHFYPEDDAANLNGLRELGFDQMVVRSRALSYFASAGWQVVAANLCQGVAKPTPVGVILEDFGVDIFPTSETVLDWCVLIAH